MLPKPTREAVVTIQFLNQYTASLTTFAAGFVLVSMLRSSTTSQSIASQSLGSKFALGSGVFGFNLLKKAYQVLPDNIKYAGMGAAFLLFYQQFGKKSEVQVHITNQPPPVYIQLTQGDLQKVMQNQTKNEN